jgi:hypothetical protein
MTMNAFENVEVAYVRVSAAPEVIERIRGEEPCEANPLSSHCVFGPGQDAYLLSDLPGDVVCEGCPVFDRKLQALEIAWENGLLNLESAYT